ncbi:hypothetical protein, partial [Paenibacillus periandrae]|uniref:hypothetical protein n=1 Tax=Paenibacillus periandrae TaxID=1761741 RepID=UPI001F097C40
YEATSFGPGAGIITNDPQKVITGQYSAYAEAAPSQYWQEFSISDPSKMQLEKNTTYTVSFKHKAVTATNGFYYFVARSEEEDRDFGWTSWTDPAGTVGSKVVTFTTGSKNKYRLLWGMNQGGGLSIDDIQVTKLNESFE